MSKILDILSQTLIYGSLAGFVFVVIKVYLRHKGICLGMHDWSYKEKWTPSIDACCVTRFQMWRRCRDCGKLEELCDDTFEEI